MTEDRGNGEQRAERTTAGRPVGPERAPGYRGALPPRTDKLARPWVLFVIAAFVLMFALSFVGIPSKLVPTPTIAPIPTGGASPSFNLAPSSSP